MTPDRTTDEYSHVLPRKEGSTWLVTWTTTIPDSDLLCWQITVEHVGVREYPAAWILMPPWIARDLLQRIASLPNAIIDNGRVCIPLA